MKKGRGKSTELSGQSTKATEKGKSDGSFSPSDAVRAYLESRYADCQEALGRIAAMPEGELKAAMMDGSVTHWNKFAAVIRWLIATLPKPAKMNALYLHYMEIRRNADKPEHSGTDSSEGTRNVELHDEQTGSNPSAEQSRGGTSSQE